MIALWLGVTSPPQVRPELLHRVRILVSLTQARCKNLHTLIEAGMRDEVEVLQYLRIGDLMISGKIIGDRARESGPVAEVDWSRRPAVIP